MSWSVSYVGKVKNAKREVRAQFKSSATYLNSDPNYAAEAKVQESARKLVSLTLRQFPKNSYVKVSAHGHQSGTWDGAKYVDNKQTVNVSIEPVVAPE
jgi:hypothetical protein